VVARTEYAGRSLADFRGLRVVFNSDDSQSGYNALRAMVAPLAQRGAFFKASVETGGHRLSVNAVREGRADLAAIDGVTWALLQKHDAPATQGLSIIGHSAPYPGLPLISAFNTDARELVALQTALRDLVQNPDAQEAMDALLIKGFECPALSIYQRCLDMEHSALAHGYPTLA
jgi:ABC-type phosphate/phosphonate transport system substrate-binding protein